MMNRYIKQSILPEVSEIGQKAIETASVLCVGAGGLGSPVLQYLVAAGVGRIGIIDADQVDLSNLQRQVLFLEEQVGASKVESAKANLLKLNSCAEIEIYSEMLSVQNVEPLFNNYDLILDCTDNFTTKYLINDAAVKFNKTVVFASVTGLEGQVSVFDSNHGPCYRCVYPESTVQIPNCAQTGVLGSVVGMIGTIQATECLKWIISRVHPNELMPMIGSLFTIDARDMSVFKGKIHKNQSCPVCSVPKDQIMLRGEVVGCSMNVPTISELEILRNPKDYLLIDVRSLDEWMNSKIPGAVHLPITLIQKDATVLKDLDITRKWVTYCVSGQRAREAVQIFADHGFQGSTLDHELGFTQLFNLR